MTYEINDYRFPYCVQRVYCENNNCTVELKGSTLLAKHLELINYLMTERLLNLYSIDYDDLKHHLQLLYW